MNKSVKYLLENSWLELAARWVLGLIFIYAAYHKIVSPSNFAKIVYGYDLFPHASINLIAIILPFVEICSGLALISGIFPRSASLIISCLLLAFMVALSINLIRGHEFDCGCFSNITTGFATSAKGWIIRDIFLLAIGLYVSFYRGYRKGCRYCQSIFRRI